MTKELKPCTKVPYKQRQKAREHLLYLWGKGKFDLKKTHWCEEHQAWHLSSQKQGNGKNYSYRD